jgi:hypothetical protein
MKTFIAIPVVSVLALAAVVSFAGAAPDKRAPSEGDRCDTSGSAPVFESFGDKRDYLLAPDGSFESAGDGWTLEAAAAAAEGGSPFMIDSPGNALSLPDGASATSPEICVDKGMPLARMFAIDTGEGRAKVRVDVLVEKRRGLDSVGGGRISPENEWDATRKFSLAQGKTSKGGTVRLQFTAKRGNSLIDGVYIDPRARH